MLDVASICGPPLPNCPRNECFELSSVDESRSSLEMLAMLVSAFNRAFVFSGKRRLTVPWVVSALIGLPLYCASASVTLPLVVETRIALPSVGCSTTRSTLPLVDSASIEPLLRRPRTDPFVVSARSSPLHSSHSIEPFVVVTR